MKHLHGFMNPTLWKLLLGYIAGGLKWPMMELALTICLDLQLSCRSSSGVYSMPDNNSALSDTLVSPSHNDDGRNYEGRSYEGQNESGNLRLLSWELQRR